MTAIKIDGKVVAAVEKALEDHAEEMFDNLGGHWMAVVELTAVERTEPGPDEEKEPTVKIRVAGIELAGNDIEDEQLRVQRRDMRRRRTASGTLDSVA